MIYSELERLCALTDTLWGAGENAFFDPVGLILTLPPEHFGYWCTPLNTVTFANTGGDGAHFGLLLTDDRDDRCPVVLSVPTADTPNIIVGETLREFLGLGCRRGYFAMDCFAFRPDEAIGEYSATRYDDDATPEEVELLRLLERSFGLTPWTNVKARLAELHLRYSALMKFSDDGWVDDELPVTIEGLVHVFVESVIAWRDGTKRGDVRIANRYVDRYSRAFAQLRSLGDRGRDALVPLLTDRRYGLRATAAAYLLRYRHDDARRVLEELARKGGDVGFGAEMTLRVWEDGSWKLDPE